MSFLFSGYSALRGDKGAEQTGAETVHKLCDRVQSSTLLEDRRAAVLGLKGLARDWKLDVGTRGMPVLINVLRNDRMDVDIVKASMETLNILCTHEKGSGEHSPTKTSEGSNDLELMFTEIFTKNASNVTLLLDILEEVDFYVRFFTVQLLNTLLQHSGSRLQECILTSPLGVSRLIDLLDDRREIIRNEGLLLLIALTQNNADIQKIIAFENAFERLLGIIMDEGATDGGIIVQDCLQLTHNLLKYNVSNQNLFRETSCIQRIPSVLIVRMIADGRPTPVDAPLTDKSIVWTEQKILNAIFVLELIRILAAPKNPSALVNQNVMNYAKIVPTLNELSFSPSLPPRVRAQALYAFGDAIRGHKANQDVVSRITLPSTEFKQSRNPVSAPTPAVLQMIQVALDAGDFPIRAAAAYAFECYVYHNPDAQLAVLSTLISPPSNNPNAGGNLENPESAGSLLVSSIVDWDASRKEPFRPWFAATLLSHALSENLQGQHLALATKLDEGEDAVSLLHKCMFALLCASRETADARISISILCLLCVWVYECPKAVSELLTEGSNIQFLVEQINQSSGVNPLVQGVAAFLLGLLYEFNDDSEPTFTRSSLQSLVTSRIGVDVYASRIERLREAKELNSASQDILKKDVSLVPDSQPEIYFDYMFVELFKSSHDRVVRSVTTVEAKGGSPKRKTTQLDEAEIQGLKDKIASQESELVKLRDKVPALEQSLMENEKQETELTLLRAQVSMLQVQLAEQAKEHTSQVDLLQESIKGLQLALQDQTEKYKELENDHEDLLVYLAEQEEQMEQLQQNSGPGEGEKNEQESIVETSLPNVALGFGDGPVPNDAPITESTELLAERVPSPSKAGAHLYQQPSDDQHQDSDTAALFGTSNGGYDHFL
ncbi:p115 like vesicle tethering protein [Powellomyces hirtus]|nr:p115 like vesicle tethering protein [Powellomyces hirtus]